MFQRMSKITNSIFISTTILQVTLSIGTLQRLNNIESQINNIDNNVNSIKNRMK
jgi:hypothetical protein